MKPTQQMSPEAQRIAIAEACGWIKFWEPGDEEQLGKWKWHRGNSNVSWRNLPDYLNDLNAMAEAEKWLKGTDQQYYNDVEFYNRWGKYQHYVFRSFGISATAAQRAEGFLRILGKWEEA